MSTLVTLIIACVPIIMTSFCTYFVSKMQRRDALREKKEEERDVDRKERADKVDQILNTQHEIKGECQRLNENQQSLIDMQAKIREGLKVSLQGDLLRSYQTFEDHGGELTQDDYDHWLQTYHAYESIGGNSFCEKLNKQVEEMKINVGHND